MARKYLDKEGLSRYSAKLQTILDKKASQAETQALLNALAERVRNNEINIASVRTDTDTNTSDIATNAGNIANNTLDINTLQELTRGHTETLATHTTDINTIKTRINAHATRIEALIAKDAEHDTDITNLQTLYTRHDTTIADLSQSKVNRTELDNYLLYSSIITDERIRELFEDNES